MITVSSLPISFSLSLFFFSLTHSLCSIIIITSTCVNDMHMSSFNMHYKARAENVENVR